MYTLRLALPFGEVSRKGRSGNFFTPSSKRPPASVMNFVILTRVLSSFLRSGYCRKAYQSEIRDRNENTEKANKDARMKMGLVVENRPDVMLTSPAANGGEGSTILL